MKLFSRFLPCFYLFNGIICLSLKHKEKFHREFTWTVAKLCGSKNAEMLGNALDCSWREKCKSVWHTHPNFALWLLLVEEEFLDLPKLKVELLSSSSSRSSSSVNRLARSGSFFRISSSVWSIFDWIWKKNLLKETTTQFMKEILTGFRVYLSRALVLMILFVLCSRWQFRFGGPMTFKGNFSIFCLHTSTTERVDVGLVDSLICCLLCVNVG